LICDHDLATNLFGVLVLLLEASTALSRMSTTHTFQLNQGALDPEDAVFSIRFPPSIAKLLFEPESSTVIAENYENISIVFHSECISFSH
jgi:hypothetical protein